MFPQETVVQMFSNIKSIYKFHNDFLLPRLEARMKDWDNDPRIGKLMLSILVSLQGVYRPGKVREFFPSG